jgi:hypothetical protein
MTDKFTLLSPGSGTWVVPADTRTITVSLTGGGGDGGTGFNGVIGKPGVLAVPAYSGGGGGSGYTHVEQEIPVTPGQIFNYHVGDRGEETTFGLYKADPGKNANGELGGAGRNPGQNGTHGLALNIPPVPDLPDYRTYNFNSSSNLQFGNKPTDWNFLHNGLSDYTMECWFKSSNTTYQDGGVGNLFYTSGSAFVPGMVVTLSDNDAYPGSNYSCSIQLFIMGGYQFVIYTTPINSWTPHVWNHVAVTFNRVTRAVNIFINGIQQTLGRYNGNGWNDTAHTLADTPNNLGAGWGNMSTFNQRITKSIVYTGNFSVPTSAVLPVIANTVLNFSGELPTDSSPNKYVVINNKAVPSQIRTDLPITLPPPVVPPTPTVDIEAGGNGGFPNGGNGGQTGAPGVYGQPGSIVIYTRPPRGLTRIKDEGKVWRPLRGLWRKTDSDTWTPVKTGWVKKEDQTWEQIYPTPAGINTPDSASANITLYQHWSTDDTRVNISNTGDYPLVIMSVSASDGPYTRTRLDLTGLGGGTPYTMQPGDSSYISYRVTGDTIGTSTGNIKFINNTGYFGTDGNISHWPGNLTEIPITTTVLPDLPGIVVTPNPVNMNLYYEDPSVSSNITIAAGTNSSPYGANLTIANIRTGAYGTTSNIPSVIGFDFNTFTANTKQFTYTAPGNLLVGEYTDRFRIYNNASTGGYLDVPLKLTVIQPHDNIIFANAGTYVWTVPPGVHHITVAAIGGGGGGGGGSYYNGYASSGGGGGYGSVKVQNFDVTPGQTYSIAVGAGGAGGPGMCPATSQYLGGTGGTSTFSGTAGTSGAGGGTGGGAGRYDSDGDNDFDEGGEITGGEPGPGAQGGTDNTGINHQGGGYVGGGASGGAGGNNGFVFISGSPKGKPNDTIINAANSSNVPVYPATNGVYPGFLNTYGVWNVPNAGDWGHNDGGFTLVANVYFRQGGTYYVYACCDNACQVTVDSTNVVNNSDWGTVNMGSITLTQGQHTITIAAQNWGGPASVGVAIFDAQGDLGNLVWSTRMINGVVPDSRNIYGRGGKGADSSVANQNATGNQGISGAVIISW